MIFCLYKLRYFGKLNFYNLNSLLHHQGPAILIANHQTIIDLYIPILLNIILKRDVFSLAAAFAFQNPVKNFIASHLNIIQVTQFLKEEKLLYFPDKLNI